LVSFRNHNAEALNLKVLHLLIELGSHEIRFRVKIS
jgi:hypothetical protein